MTETYQRIEPAVLIRPNGKTYRARKVMAHAWSNIAAYGGDDAGVVILGTHDVEGCREFAVLMVRYWGMGEFADGPRIGWFRDGYGAHGPAWVDDAERGAAGVMWTAATS